MELLHSKLTLKETKMFTLESKYRVYGYLQFAPIEQVKLEMIATINQYKLNKNKYSRDEVRNYIGYFKERLLKETKIS